MESLKIQFDRNYGINKRTGWSICVNGCFYTQLERFLVVALIKAVRMHWFIIDKQYR